MHTKPFNITKAQEFIAFIIFGLQEHFDKNEIFV